MSAKPSRTEAYRNQSLAHVQESFTNDIRFASRVINGVKLIAIDDSYYRFDNPQLEKLKKKRRIISRSSS